MNSPRINARIDEDTEDKVRWLTTATGQTVSHVVRESVAAYYAQVRAQQAPKRPMRLLAMAGQFRSSTDGQPSTLSTDYKDLYGEYLERKYGPAPKSLKKPSSARPRLRK
jgi:predicted transcriptional regulator